MQNQDFICPIILQVMKERKNVKRGVQVNGGAVSAPCRFNPLFLSCFMAKGTDHAKPELLSPTWGFPPHPLY